MFAVEVYAAIRRFVFVEGRSRREAARVFGLSRDTIGKMCRFSVPLRVCSQQATGEAEARCADPCDQMRFWRFDKTAPAKQRHTAKRIYERLRDEHGSFPAATRWSRIMCGSRGRATARSSYCPLSHPPGHAQMDFGESVGVIGGLRMKLHVFCL